MRVATFNVQNLRLRQRDGKQVLDGAFDRDMLTVSRPIDVDLADRRETARIISSANADVVALQEVFDLPSLHYFHDTFLLSAGSRAYDFRYCFPGNDGHGLNVAALSNRPPVNVSSHAELTGDDLDLLDLPSEERKQVIFRRDCLELHFEALSIFVCHFKAPYPDPEKAFRVRSAEARAVRKIVEARFETPGRERWIIVGDLNEPFTAREAGVSSLEPLLVGFSVDLMDRLDPGDDWTYELPDTHLHLRPDRILVSPLLAEEYPDTLPVILRSGLRSGTAGSGKPQDNPDRRQPQASDHALVYADFPNL